MVYYVEGDDNMTKPINRIIAFLLVATFVVMSGCDNKKAVSADESLTTDKNDNTSAIVSDSDSTESETETENKVPQAPVLDDEYMENKLSEVLGHARKSQYVLHAKGKGTSLIINSDRTALNGNVACDGTMNVQGGNVNVRGDLYAHTVIKDESADVKTYHTISEDYDRILINPDDAVIATAGNPEKTDTYKLQDTDDGKSVTDIICTSSDIKEKTDNITVDKSIITDGSITFDCNDNISSSEGVTIYSKGYNVTLNAENISLKGVIYCPVGKVTINCKRFEFEGIIVANTIEINATTAVISENTELPETLDFCYYNDMCDVGLNSHYATSDKKIGLSWTTQFDDGTFDLYTSADDDKYTYVSTIQGSKKYTYNVSDVSQYRYFKLYHILPCGIKVESEKVKLKYNDNLKGYILMSEDSDKDGVSESKEYFSHTRPFLADTDGDMLTDYQEIYITGTDPLYADSNENGVIDYYDDEDKDGIANYLEIQKGTSPVRKDTDGDTISDYDELYKYGTNPLKKDSDGDTIEDNDEIKLGLDPLNTSTHGTADKAYIITQNISSDGTALYNINNRNDKYTLTMTSQSAGYADKQITCGVSRYQNSCMADFIVGDMIELSYSNSYPLQCLDIAFTPDKNQYSEKGGLAEQFSEFRGSKLFQIFKFDEDKKMLIPCETKYDGDKVYTSVSEAEGTYALVNVAKWLSSMGFYNTSEKPYILSLKYNKSSLVFPFTDKDSDGDGISDTDEVNKTLAGSSGYCNLSELIDMNVIASYPQEVKDFISGVKIIPLFSDPLNADTDGDTISDGSKLAGKAVYANDSDVIGYSYPYYNEQLSELRLSHPDWKFDFTAYNVSFNDLITSQYNTEWTSSIFKSSEYAIPFLDSQEKVTSEFLSRIDDLLVQNKMEITTDNRLKLINRALDSGFTLITKEGIGYYADPETYLNEKYIYAFMDLSCEGIDISSDTLKALCQDSFYDSNVTSPSVDDYVKYMMDAGKEYGINPYYLAVKSFVEHGAKSPSGNYHIMIKGYPLNIDGKRVKVYNFGGIGANNGPGAVYDSAVYAYEHGWTTPQKALLGMAEFTVKNYISRGQDNFYKQRFDIDSLVSGNKLHQYGTATNMVTALSNNYSSYLKELLSSDNVTFDIPVFK